MVSFYFRFLVIQLIGFFFDKRKKIKEVKLEEIFLHLIRILRKFKA